MRGDRYTLVRQNIGFKKFIYTDQFKLNLEAYQMSIKSEPSIILVEVSSASLYLFPLTIPNTGIWQVLLDSLSYSTQEVMHLMLSQAAAAAAAAGV